MDPQVIEIDGDDGEGGGRIVRGAVALAAALRRAVRIRAIRPGLGERHVAAVTALAAVCDAQVTGATVGSDELTFRPGRLRAGAYRFDLGAASAPQAALALLGPMTLAGGDSRVELIGATHTPHAPCAHHLRDVMGPLLTATGAQSHLSFERAGFGPGGGGRIALSVVGFGGGQPLIGLHLRGRGDLRYIEGVSAAAESLPEDVADRQASQAVNRLRQRGLRASLEQARWATDSRGAAVFLRAVFARCVAGFTAVGAGDVGPEGLADRAVEQLLVYLDGDGAVDARAAEQLPALLAVGCEPSRYTTAEVTDGLRRQGELVRRIAGRDVVVDGQLGQPGEVFIGGA